MKFLPLIFLAASLNTDAQTTLKFDHLFVESEDKWVAFPPDSLGESSFGFIYIDATAGLTLQYGGKLKVAENLIERKSGDLDTMSIKYRLKPNSMRVAVIPPGYFAALNIKETPDWLRFYKNDSNSVQRLFKWGFMYNGWDQPAKALEYLLRAEKVDPDFPGLQTEIAFSYNALGDYSKAIGPLQKLVTTGKADCYTFKELAFAQQELGKVTDAIDTFIKCVKSCRDNTMVSEIAYNIAYRYSVAKDKENFDLWSAQLKKYAKPGDKYLQNIIRIEEKFK